MAKWEAIDLNEIPNFREGHRGRVSYPLLKSFLESGLPIGKLDRQGIQQTLLTLNSCLNAYIQSHNLPIKIFQRGGEIFAARTDLDPQGKPNPLYNQIQNIPRQGKLQPASPEDIAAAPPITDDEVDTRFAASRNNTTI
jgi:hypothetical protein